jgi:hypothetical protein
VIGQLRLLAPDPADRVPDPGADRLTDALGVVTSSLTVAASLSAIHTVASVVSTRRRIGPASSRGSSKTTSPRLSSADMGRGFGSARLARSMPRNVRLGRGTGCSSRAGFIQTTDPGAQLRGHLDTGASAEAQAPPPHGDLPAALTVMHKGPAYRSTRKLASKLMKE